MAYALLDFNLVDPELVVANLRLLEVVTLRMNRPGDIAKLFSNLVNAATSSIPMALRTLARMRVHDAETPFINVRLIKDCDNNQRFRRPRGRVSWPNKCLRSHRVLFINMIAMKNRNVLCALLRTRRSGDRSLGNHTRVNVLSTHVSQSAAATWMPSSSVLSSAASEMQALRTCVY